MKKTSACIWLSPADRAALEGWVTGRSTPQKLVWRGRIVLLSADRVGVMTIVRSVGKSKVTVGALAGALSCRRHRRAATRRDAAGTQAAAERRDDRAGRAQDLA